MITVLFACTGNTCRSPIAAAIATEYARLHRLPITVISAGIHARDGDSITPEAATALTNIGINARHHSQEISRDLIAQCDAIFVMESWQRDAITQKITGWVLDTPPDVRMLDPDRDIIDPLGRGQKSYDDLTGDMLGLIPNCLKGLEIAPHRQQVD